MGVSCGGHLVLGVPSRRHCALRAVRFLRWLDETPFEDLSDIFQGDLNSDLIQGFIPDSDARPEEESSPKAAEKFLGFGNLRRMSRVFKHADEVEG
eukprot:g11366.t1